MPLHASDDKRQHEMTDRADPPQTYLDWSILLAVAGRLGVRVWRVDRHGVLSPVKSPDEGER